MSTSKEEEIIATLWIIIAVLSYANNLNWLMWITGILGISSLITSLHFAIKDSKQETNQ